MCRKLKRAHRPDPRRGLANEPCSNAVADRSSWCVRCVVVGPEGQLFRRVAGLCRRCEGPDADGAVSVRCGAGRWSRRRSRRSSPGPRSSGSWWAGSRCGASCRTRSGAWCIPLGVVVVVNPSCCCRLNQL